MQQEAVVVKNAYKRYGKTQDPVFDGLNLIVPQGCIYGLLGASGCGKTTLLSCIVGVRKLDRGEIWVLGGRPGQKGSGIPGPRVGYMPQEVALVGEFSVVGALYFFGRINGLEDSDIKQRYDFFSDLLQLPPKDRLMKNISGGEQRRVSFAASLIHRPELLILDEPTVGLDSILRDSIWQYLIKLTEEEGTAVIVTSHYMEETKLANRIGLLRGGHLLADTTPTALLSRFHCQNLEDTFLILSQRQEERKNREIGDANSDGDAIGLEHLSTEIPTAHCSNAELTNNQSQNQQVKIRNKSNTKYPQLSSTYGKVFKALMAKNLLQILRHPGGLMFAFIFPIIITTIFFYSIGGDPKDIVMAIVNDETGHCDSGRYLGYVIYKPDKDTCDYIDISCRFLHGFNESFMIKQYFNTLEEASLAVKSGKATGTIYFGQNFSQAFQYRRDFLDSLGEEDFVASEIQIALDMSDYTIGFFLQKKLYDQFFEIQGEIVSNCNISKKFTAMPIFFEKPVFGRLDQQYLDFMTPGFILTLTFFLSSAVSSFLIITDRAEGVWDRSLVQGVTTSAILFSHILTQLLVITIQATTILVITFACFQVTCRGSLVMVIVLILLTSITAMCYGFVISALCTSHTMANMMSIGSVFPLSLLNGFMWPLEAMPLFLRYLSYTLPTTVPTFALRGLVDKGLSIFDFEVYSGFCVTILWIAAFIAICLKGLRRRV